MKLNTQKNQSAIDWTHFKVKITDIRLFNKLYIIYTDIEEVSAPLFINKTIFEDRLNNFFIGKEYKREDILALEWNMYVTKDFYVKVDGEGNLNKIAGNTNKWYVSYLDVEGDLGEFSFVYKNEIIKKTAL